MTRVVDLYPTSDDDLGNMEKRSVVNRRATPAAKKTTLAPETGALIPKIKATSSSRRIRRLRTRKVSPENPLFKSWTEKNSSLFGGSTKESVSRLGRRTASRPSTEERDDGAELNAPRSPTARLVPEFNCGFQGHIAHLCDPTEDMDKGREDQLTNGCVSDVNVCESQEELELGEDEWVAPSSYEFPRLNDLQIHRRGDHWPFN